MKTPVPKIAKKSEWVYVEKKTRSEILTCTSCGAKYIKTRKGQVVCIKCSLKLIK